MRPYCAPDVKATALLTYQALHWRGALNSAGSPPRGTDPTLLKPMRAGV